MASVFLYTKNSFIEVPLQQNKVCETTCTLLCQDLGITPTTQLLFGLRIHGTKHWVPPSKELVQKSKYEFRMRFRIPNLSTLKQLDRNAYNYYFEQVRRDFVSNIIDEIDYAKQEQKVVGLIITDMYKDMVEKNVNVEYLKKNFRSYSPKVIVERHPYYLRKTIVERVKQIKNMNIDADYVKSIYIEQVKYLAPNYLSEEYSGDVENVDEPDSARRRFLSVKIRFVPFHQDMPGLYYSYINEWKHIARIEDILAIIIDEHLIKLELKTQPMFTIRMGSQEAMESFVTCIAGYYRLMCKWTIDLCSNFKTPSLEILMNKTMLCHGPIGGQFAYSKLEEKSDKSNPCGTYLLRQCGKEYNTYYIDIITTNRFRPETIKITWHKNKWYLHKNTIEPEEFDNLIELAKSIETEAKHKLRIPPLDYDKSPFSLLCLPEDQFKLKKVIDAWNPLSDMKPQIIDATKELQLYRESIKKSRDGILTQMRADWKLPDNKQIEVTLKILNSTKLKFLPEILKLSNMWAKLNTPDILRLYGMSLYQPVAMVMESTKYGPLDEFLRKSASTVGTLGIPTVLLIDAAFSLAKALHYLQESGIVHTKIRCSTLQVHKFNSPNLLVVKLGDPGFEQEYTKEDLPWIPPECMKNIESAKTSLKAEIFAYGTTLWEIFNFGCRPHEYLLPKNKNKRNIIPKHAPLSIVDVIMDAWNPDPDHRFTPQNIFSTLIMARSKESKTHSYITPSFTNHIHTSQTSVETTETEKTVVTLMDNVSINSAESEPHSSHSAGTTLSRTSNSGSDYSQWTSGNDVDDDDDDDDDADGCVHENYKEVQQDIDGLATKFILDEGEVICQGFIGGGQYGKVYRGEYIKNDGTFVAVAIKHLTTLPTNDRANNDSKANIIDFKREIAIMKRLDHPNIVKIINFVEESSAIIMEYVQFTSFEKYLAYYKPNLTTPTLLRFARDIACGMEYLRSKNIVHRDLAARNCLVDKTEQIKISDFGLAHELSDDKLYYTIQSRRALPMKGYAPETLLSGKYSFESDVWSYGVTLFEMFSRGLEPDLIPDKTLEMAELYDLLKAGKRLARPAECPENVYDVLMLPCWHETPQRRPTFTQLRLEIDRLLAEYGELI